MTPTLVARWLVVAVALAPTLARGEFQVNSYTTGAQYRPSVAASPAGFVVVWVGPEADGTGSGVFGQRYDGAGAALGAEFQVSAPAVDYARVPSVGMDSTGGFVVAWGKGSSSFFDEDIIGRRYDSSGVPAGGEFVVNTYTTSIQTAPAVAMDASGNFVVMWHAFVPGPSVRVRGQRYDNNGMALGGEFEVNTYTTGFQFSPAVAMHAAGDFVVVWTGGDQEGPGNLGIFGQRYDASGATVGGEFHVNTATTGTQDYPAIAAEPAGGFVVVWQGQNGIDYSDILARRYDAAGVPVGGEFVVNTYTNNNESYPAVAADGAGFVVVWQVSEEEFSNSFHDVRGQRYDGAGVRRGGEFQVNTGTADDQRRPRVASAGDFVTVWESGINSFDVFGQVNKPDRLIRGRRLQVGDRRGSEDGRNVLVFGTESSTEIGPAIDGDPTVDGATLRIIANGTTSSDETFVLDAAGWRAAAPTGFRYTGPTGADGDPVKRVLLKRTSSGIALVKVLLRGSTGTQSLDVVPPNTGTDGGLILDIGGGGGRYCVTLGGPAGGTEIQDTATGWKVLRATAEPGCPAP